MKWLSAGLTFVNATTVGGLLLGTALAGLGPAAAAAAFVFGAIIAVLAFLQTGDVTLREHNADASCAVASREKYRHIWLWLVAACFAFFAFRSFCWLIFIDGNQLRVQSPNNLGDLALHIAYIKNFASGVPLWPENPIYVFSNMRYPAGTDLFNSLLLLVGVDLIRGLVWTGIIASVAMCYALYRWSGAFGIAGFLFNGGLAGFAVLQTWELLDYQGDKAIAWKSLPLSMFVTQRGVLYALPAGLLLLYHWRSRYFDTSPARSNTDIAPPPTTLPFWLELAFYATMPLFHVHTFIALSTVAAFLFAIGTSAMRKQLATMVGLAFVPATFFMWTITDHFRAGSVLKWKAGWVQNSGDMAMPFFKFWLLNFGAFMPLLILLIWVCVARARRPNEQFRFNANPALVFVTTAVVILLFAYLVKTAPWEWDNIKLIIWAYLIVLPFLWSELIARWPVPIRVALCVALFGSGLVSLFGGLAAGRPGFAIADRAEIDFVGAAVNKLPLEARFASYPTYNHPLLLQGRRVVMGYPGHLWTQGFDYGVVEKQLEAVMRGAPDWKEQARALGARYIFWGKGEQTAYTGSTRPWEKEALLVASGNWGAIYDLDVAPTDAQPAGQ